MIVFQSQLQKMTMFWNTSIHLFYFATFFLSSSGMVVCSSGVTHAGLVKEGDGVFENLKI